MPALPVLAASAAAASAAADAHSAVAAADVSSAVAAADAPAASAPARRAAPADGTRAPMVHPRWLRIVHWLNAGAVALMLTSGWRIYNAAPLFDFRFPAGITLGGWLGGALQWHFAAMWLLVVNGTAYLVLALATGRITTRLWPVSPAQAWRDARAALRGRLGHADLSHYNHVQRIAYLFAIADLVALVLSGLVLWKSVQFGLLRTLLGGYEAARHVHFGAMALLAGFIAVHVVMALAVPRSLRAMILGR